MVFIDGRKKLIELISHLYLLVWITDLSVLVLFNWPTYQFIQEFYNMGYNLTCILWFWQEKSIGQNMLEQETGNSGSSKASSIFTNERSMNASISPVFLSSRKISPKTEGHPNALKNIKNYPLLHASILDMINPKEGNDFGQFRRSFSTLDFRLDPNKLSSLYGSNSTLDREVWPYSIIHMV